jgi:hypothetical protein
MHGTFNPLNNTQVPALWLGRAFVSGANGLIAPPLH